MVYLLKSILCLLVLLLIHRVLLQQEVLHRFNRFYLLIAVVSSFLIPLFTIEIPAEENQIFNKEVASNESLYDPEREVDLENPVDLPIGLENSIQLQGEKAKEAELGDNSSESTFPWIALGWTAYLLVSFLFLIRFLRNVQVLRAKIRNNPHVGYRGETLVLHSENQSPFSFLKYIFVSRRSFEREGISDAVFAHEQSHVREKHSWDILFIEALLVPFWFHPGLHFAKQAIRLNHEFIADQAALNITSIKDYQQLLLNILLAKPTQPMASSLNFSLTKKRMQMMKKNAGGPFKWVKIAVLLPLIGFVIYLFSEKVTAQADAENQEISTVSSTVDSTGKDFMNIRLISDREIEVNGELVSLVEFAGLIDGIQSENTTVKFSANPGVKMGVLADVQEILRKNEIRRVVYEDQTNQNQNTNSKDEKEAYYRNAYILVEDENMEYTHKTYAELSEVERKGLLGPMKPLEKQHPDPVLFESWKDNKTYAILIDGVVIANEKLNGYAASDFVGFFQSSVSANARSDRFLQPYQVHLYSDKYYNKEFGPDSENRQPRTGTDTITLTQRRVTWHKDISRYPDPTTDYLQKYARYEKLRTSEEDFETRSQEEKSQLNLLYGELSKAYSTAKPNWQKNSKKPIPPHDASENQQPEDNEQKGIESALIVYLDHYKDYQFKASENRFSAKKTNKEIEVLLKEYNKFGDLYAGLSFPEKRMVQRPEFPYAKLEIDGEMVYKRFEDLTAEELKGLRF